MSITNRLAEFIESIKITRIEFDSNCGLKKGYFNSAFNNQSEISSDKLGKICSRYPQLNIEWVITGNGSMLKGIAAQDPTLKDCLEKKNQLTDMLLEKDAEIKRLKSNNKRISSKP